MVLAGFSLRGSRGQNHAQNRREVPAEAGNINRAQSVRVNVLVRGAFAPKTPVCAGGAAPANFRAYRRVFCKRRQLARTAFSQAVDDAKFL